MRADAAAADRAHAVRAASRQWRKAGLVSDAVAERIEQQFPDDRVRARTLFRLLLGVFTLIGGVAIISLAAAIFEHGKILAITFGIVFALLTERQLGKQKRAQGGSEEATSLLAIGCLLTGIGMIIDRMNLSSQDFGIVLLAIVCAVGILATWRWGMPVYAVLAAGAFFGLLAMFPGGRFLWIVAACLLSPVLFRASQTRKLPPALRRSCALALIMGLASLYLAVHIGSIDGRWIEQLGYAPTPNAALSVLRTLSPFLMALVSLLALWLGLRHRSRLLMNSAALMIVASLVTIRFYVHIAPLWVVLCGAGAAGIAVALGIRRYLNSGADRERFGFTAEPLKGGESIEVAEVAAILSSISPTAAPAAAKGFQGGGGESGGGGASGNF